MRKSLLNKILLTSCIAVLFISCKKSSECNSNYQIVIGKLSFYYADYDQNVGGGSTEIFPENFYVYEFLENCSVKIWHYDSLLVQGELANIKWHSTGFGIVCDINGSNDQIYHTSLHQLNDTLWKKAGGPGPEAPGDPTYLIESYFIKTE